MTGGKEDKSGFSRSLHFAEVDPFLPLRTRLKGESKSAQPKNSPSKKARNLILAFDQWTGLMVAGLFLLMNFFKLAPRVRTNRL